MSVFAAAHIRNMQLAGIDVGTLVKACKAIGLLHDFYVLKLGSPVLDKRGMQLLAKQFYEARRYGCEELGWTPVKVTTAQADLRHVTDFSLFCETNFGHAPTNPIETVLVEQLSGPELQAWLARADARKRWDMLFHLHGATKEGQGKLTRAKYRPELGKAVRSQTAKGFPPTQVLAFIREARSIRDRLCWLLIFFGGLRISELMHLFARDISLAPDGTARVTLAHPRDGEIDWVDSARHRRQGSRAAFLLDQYGTIPRNLLPSSHPNRAGWKGMLYDDSRNKQSFVNWTDDRMGRLFWQLHQRYMREVRVHAGNAHPYYFVSQRGEDFGEPLKLANLHKQFYRCAERVGLASSDDGVNPHGGRHFYGYYAASWLKLSKERVQKLMHHTSPLSTEVYYRIDEAVVRDELKKAQAHMAQDLPAFLGDRHLLLSMEGGNDE